MDRAANEPSRDRIRQHASRAARAATVALALAGCAARTPADDAVPAASALPVASAQNVAGAQVPAPRCVARPAAQMPQQLSALGCFDGDDPRWLGPEAIAFSVNAPLWTDGADKERFLAVPPGAHIALDEQGDFVLPTGSVLGKTFVLGGARVETRILMNDATEGWQGYSYRWNAEGTDAELVAAEGESMAAVGERAQPWTIPARNQCGGCHTPETHVSLGLEVAQLNGDFVDPVSGEGGNQLDRLIARGLLDGAHPTLATPEARPKLADYHDASQPIDARARAYLHANCGSCHTARENLCSGDLRWSASGSEMGVCDVAPKIPDASFPIGAALLAPGAPERSVLVQRVMAEGGSALAMPPIGRHGVDAAGVALLNEWVTQMRACGQ